MSLISLSSNWAGSDAAWDVMQHGMQAVSSSITASGNSCKDFVMKIFQGLSSCSTDARRAVVSYLEKNVLLSTGKLFLGGLPRNSVDKITYRPCLTSAVYCVCKASNQTKNMC